MLREQHKIRLGVPLSVRVHKINISNADHINADQNKLIICRFFYFYLDKIKKMFFDLRFL